MTLLTLRDAHLAYGDFPLLDHAQLSIQDGERIGLIGRNGTGKSTLLKVLTGLATLDDGASNVATDCASPWWSRNRYCPPPRPNMTGSWRCTWSASGLSSRARPRPAPVASASGRRWRRHSPPSRTCCCWMNPPITWISPPSRSLQELLGEVGAALIITHDREFLDRIASRIVELDRGVLRSYQGNFARYQELKDQELASESASNARFDKLLAQEEVWIRKGVEARRTRNEGRVVRLEQLRRERAARRERIGRVNLQLDSGERSGKLVAELEEVSLSFGDRCG